jgi:hypothetical protein
MMLDELENIVNTYPKYENWGEALKSGVLGAKVYEKTVVGEAEQVVDAMSETLHCQICGEDAVEQDGELYENFFAEVAFGDSHGFVRLCKMCYGHLLIETPESDTRLLTLFRPTVKSRQACNNAFLYLI